MTSRKPPIKTFFHQSEYNCLMALLEKFFYVHDNEDYFKKMSRKLFDKIEKFSRIINDDGNQFVQVNFFEEEASFLIEISILQLTLQIENPINYFEKLSEKHKNKIES